MNTTQTQIFFLLFFYDLFVKLFHSYKTTFPDSVDEFQSRVDSELSRLDILYVIIIYNIHMYQDCYVTFKQQLQKYRHKYSIIVIFQCFVCKTMQADNKTVLSRFDSMSFRIKLTQNSHILT